MNERVDNIMGLTASILGVAFSVQDVYSILGIVCTSISIILLVIRTAIAVYNKIKNKDIKGAIEDINKAKDEIEDITEDNKNGK